MSAEAEKALHEQVAQGDSHEDQTRGVVGWFYRLYIQAASDYVERTGGRILDIGSGEGMIFKDSSVRPIQIDISPTRLARARRFNNLLVCADAYALPFKDGAYDTVLMIAMLEHVSRPRVVLEEAFRVLKSGGHALVVVPNDVNLSLGRLLLRKWPPRYPDHLTFFTPGRLTAMIGRLFVYEHAAPMPFGKDHILAQHVLLRDPEEARLRIG